MKKKVLIILLLFCGFFTQAQTGNYVFSGAEATLFTPVDFATPTGISWGTFRGATPGYFSVSGAGGFTGANDANHVNGYVKKYGNTAFTYPVGTGTDLRTLSISAPSNATDAFGTAWILGNPTTTVDPTDGGTHAVTSKAADVYAVDTTGQWDWVNASGNPTGIIATASIPNVSTLGPVNTLRLVGWNGTQWINLSTAQGSTAASGGTENSTLTGTLQNGITALGVGRVTIVVNAKVFLQGAYIASTGLMRTNLRTLNLLPLTQPYSAAPWSYAGTETVASIPANVTDWILVELRNSSNVLVDRRAGFLLNNGNIVDIDGVSTLRFVNQPEANYIVAIRHRNHITIRTPAVTSVNPSMVQYNYTTAQSQAFQNVAITSNTAMQSVSGTFPAFVMWGGNAANTSSGETSVRNSGSPVVNDYSRILSTLGTSATVSGYYSADLNLDGNVRTSGAPAVNDYTLLLNILGTLPQISQH